MMINQTNFIISIYFGTLIASLSTDLHINKYYNMKMYKSLLKSN